MKLFEGKTVLVTGGSTGIGRAAATGAAQHGANVAINYVSSDDKAQSCIAELAGLGQLARRPRALGSARRADTGEW